MDQDFIDQCPAWARQLGVKDMETWKVIYDLGSWDWDSRQQMLHESNYSEDTRHLIMCVLRAWDSMDCMHHFH
jgi:hypothetical protein